MAAPLTRCKFCVEAAFLNNHGGHGVDVHMPRGKRCKKLSFFAVDPLLLVVYIFAVYEGGRCFLFKN
jgi:hypothetical protein